MEEIKNSIAKLQEEVYAIKTTLAVHESKIVKLEEQLENIESNTSWTVKLVLSGVIIAALEVILK